MAAIPNSEHTMNLRKLVRDACVILISFVLVVANGNAIANFTNLGAGECVGFDENGNLASFDWIANSFGGNSGGTTQQRAEACATWCIDPNVTPPDYLQYLVGFDHYVYGDDDCLCSYVHGQLPPELTVFSNSAVVGLHASGASPYRCWKHNNDSSDPPPITVIETLFAAGIILDQCDASAAKNGLESLKCAASIDIPFSVGQLKVAIEDNHCTNNGPDTSIRPDTSSTERGGSSNVGVGVTTGVDVSASKIKSGIDNRDGTRSVVKYHCFRADFYPSDVDGSTSSMSILAKKWNVTSTFTYDMDGDFEVDVVTEAFTPSFTSDNESRAVEVFINDNACSNTAESAGPYSIKSVMTVCVWVVDSDVIISGVKNAKMQLQGSNHEVTAVDNASDPSFVTSLSGGTVNTFEIKTLLLPEIFDEFDGGSGNLTFVGTCLLTYTNGHRLSGNKRFLEKEEEVPFSIEIQVEAGVAAPNIAHLYVESGSHQLRVGIAAFGLGMAAMI